MDAALGLFKSIGGALLALAVIAVIGWIAISRIRAWMKAPEDTDEGFTLSDLRRLHREGALSDEEYERAHAQILSAVRSKPSSKERIPPKHPPLASPVDHRIRTTEGAEPPRESAPGQQARPIVRPDASGRIVIRDANGEPHGQSGSGSARPKRPTDPRTGQGDG